MFFFNWKRYIIEFITVITFETVDLYIAGLLFFQFHCVCKCENDVYRSYPKLLLPPQLTVSRVGWVEVGYFLHTTSRIPTVYPTCVAIMVRPITQSVKPTETLEKNKVSPYNRTTFCFGQINKVKTRWN